MIASSINTIGNPYEYKQPKFGTVDLGITVFTWCKKKLTNLSFGAHGIKRKVGRLVKEILPLYLSIRTKQMRRYFASSKFHHLQHFCFSKVKNLKVEGKIILEMKTSVSAIASVSVEIELSIKHGGIEKFKRG